MEYVGEQGGVYVAAAEDGNGFAIGDKFGRVEEEGGGGDGTARFGN